MRKFKAVLLLCVTLIMLVSSVVPAMAEVSGSPGIIINNQALTSNVLPANLNGTMLVPAKEFANALGGSFSYNHSTLSAAVALGENELAFRLDNSMVKHNGKYIQAPLPMKVIGNRLMVPVQFAASKLGAEVVMNTAKNQLLVFQPVNGKIIYKVVPGDTLWIISRLFGTTITAIKEYNNLTSDSLYIGQELIVKNYTPVNTVLPAQTIKNATLRSGAGFDFNPLAYVSSGVDISVLGKIGDWFKVITPKGNGFMHYTVVGVKQDMNDTAPNTSYFNSKIPVDTSKDFITYSSYTVQKGDTLWSIAEKVGIPDYELAQANNISLGTMLSIGQILKIPVHNIPVKATLGPQAGEILDWFTEAQYVFPIGKEGKLIDLETGKSFMIRRTMGANHSDTETLTVRDTEIMKEIFGGSWTWDRKSFILEADGRRFAVSVAGMAHAGVDSEPYMANVYNRSDNWGYGPNYDRIKGNGMDGHFDMYFLNGLRHKDNLLDAAHQYKVLVSGGLE